MDDFEFKFSDINLIHSFLLSYDINIKDFLTELFSFVRRMDFILGDCNSPLASIFVCHQTVMLTLKTSSCSDAYSKLLRRKLGLNGLESLPMLKKISLTTERVVFYVEPLIA